MGMEERALASSSAAWTCLRMETKWDESFSAASGDNLGAQRLGDVSSCASFAQKKEGLTICSN